MSNSGMRTFFISLIILLLMSLSLASTTQNSNKHNGNVKHQFMDVHQKTLNVENSNESNRLSPTASLIVLAIAFILTIGSLIHCYCRLFVHVPEEKRTSTSLFSSDDDDNGY
eukprot:490452_1